MIPMLLPMLGKAVDVLLDRIPDPKAKEAARQAFAQAQADNAFKDTELQLSAIIAEAQSSDPFTSRARPSFLYVIYALMLSAIPMGVLYAFSPETANDITQGFKDWLNAIPEPYIQLFGVGYLGYTGARTIDKRRPK